MLFAPLIQCRKGRVSCLYVRRTAYKKGNVARTMLQPPIITHRFYPRNSFSQTESTWELRNTL